MSAQQGVLAGAGRSSRRKLRYAAPVIAAVAGLGFTSLASAAVYTGNGGTGFGGPIGTSSMTVTDDGLGNIDFTLNSGNFSGNVLVLYLDTKPGGINDTSTLTDTADGGRTAASGLSNNGRTLATFAPGFGADYALVVEPQFSFAGVFDILNVPSNFGFNQGANYGSAAGNTPPYTFSVSRAALGLGPTAPLSFEGTLISPTAYRSNETYGTSVTTPGTAGDTPNAGFTGTTTFSTADTYAVPEPASAGLLGLGTMVFAFRRRRDAARG